MKGAQWVKTFITACSIILSLTFFTHTPGYAQGLVDYSVTLASNPSLVFSGNSFTYTVTNNAYAMGVGSFSGLVTDTITSNTAFTINNVSWGSPLNCTWIGNNITCSYFIEGALEETNTIRNNIAPPQITYTFPIRVVITPLAAGVITYTASVGGNMPDPNPGNNLAILRTVVQQGQGVSVIVPTMRDWGMLILIVLLGITSLYFLKLKTREG